MKISLKEAFKKTGMKHKDIMAELSLTHTYYSRFVENKSVTKPQAIVIEKITGIEIEKIDVVVK